jgi:asparagine synthase (glutamine-hydrolysing)
MMGDFAAMLGSDVPGLVPRVARHGEWIGVGLVRLDEQPGRPPLARDPARGAGTDVCTTESGVADSHATDGRTGNSGAADGNVPDRDAADLATVLETLAESGASGVSKLVGDFAFVAWNREQRQLVAARDTFGVRRLYMARRGDLLTFSTRASLLARTESYDLEYFAEYLLHGDDPSGRTAFKDVEAVRSAELVTWERGTLRRTRYWEPPVEGTTIAKSGPEIVEEFRNLLFDAVRSRLGGEKNVWSHLTGGMDSSSVVAVAQTLAARGAVERGLAGVVTYESDPPLGGDVDHARMVAERYGLRHEILDGWRLWDYDGSAPPAFDQPTYEQASHTIARRLAEVALQNGGRVFLTGLGGDLYLRPQFERAADLLARKQYGAALATVAGWAVATRQSFWRLLAMHGVYPLLPPALRYAFGKPEMRVPAWISSEFEQRFELRYRAGAMRNHSARRGALASPVVVDSLLTHAGRVCNDRIGESNVEWRHPFLHRPLVEFGMRLPQDWLVAPGMDLSKRVLREATVGILPEPVRLRRGKGGLQPGIHDALVREKGRLTALAAHPRLAELGCVDEARFARAVAEAATRPRGEAHLINTALTLEVWLNRRADRWS